MLTLILAANLTTTGTPASLTEKQIEAGTTMSGDVQKKETREQSLARRRISVMDMYGEIIIEAAKQYNVDPILVATMITQESWGQKDAVSKAGARGLMQLMPPTAKGLGVTNSNDPRQNIFGGTKYIAQQLKTFNGDVAKALAAYNAGPGNVKRYGGVPPFKETRNYVKHIMGAMNIPYDLEGRQNAKKPVPISLDPYANSPSATVRQGEGGEGGDVQIPPISASMPQQISPPQQQISSPVNIIEQQIKPIEDSLGENKLMQILRKLGGLQ